MPRGSWSPVTSIPCRVTLDRRIVGDRLVGLGACDMKGSLAVMLELASSRAASSRGHVGLLRARGDRSQRIGSPRDRRAAARSARRPTPRCSPSPLAESSKPAARDLAGGHRVDAASGRTRPDPSREGTPSIAWEPLLATSRVLRASHGRISMAWPTSSNYRRCRSRGDGPNVVPDLATCTLNHRVAPDRTRDQAIASLVAFLDGVPSSNRRHGERERLGAGRRRRNSPTASRRTGGDSPEPCTKGKVGWTDVATFSELGIPATNFGPATRCGPPQRRIRDVARTRRVRAHAGRLARLAGGCGERLRVYPRGGSKPVPAFKLIDVVAAMSLLQASVDQYGRRSSLPAANRASRPCSSESVPLCLRRIHHHGDPLLRNRGHDPTGVSGVRTAPPRDVNEIERVIDDLCHDGAKADATVSVAREKENRHAKTPK